MNIDICCICLEPTNTFTKCNHQICEECCDKMRCGDIKPVCPLCRRDIKLDLSTIQDYRNTLLEQRELLFIRIKRFINRKQDNPSNLISYYCTLYDDGGYVDKFIIKTELESLLTVFNKKKRDVNKLEKRISR